MTGLSDEQRDALCDAVAERVDVPTRGRPCSPGLRTSVDLVLVAWRSNLTQQLVAAIFSTSQSTVSRRCEALKAPIEDALTGFVPDPVEVTRGDTILVDGTLVPTSDWADQDGLYSGKHHRTGFNVQVAATVAGFILAIGLPVHGARHDAFCWQESGLAARLAGLHALADLGYVGIDGVETGVRRRPGQPLTDREATLNRSLSVIRSAIERAIAHLKNWKVLKTGYRGPLDRFASLLRVITTLHHYEYTSNGF